MKIRLTSDRCGFRWWDAVKARRLKDCFQVFDQRRQIVRLHAAGESVASLVDTFKVSRRTVYRALEVAE